MLLTVSYAFPMRGRVGLPCKAPPPRKAPSPNGILYGIRLRGGWVRDLASAGSIRQRLGMDEGLFDAQSLPGAGVFRKRD